MARLRRNLRRTYLVLGLACASLFSCSSQAAFANLAILGDSLSDQGRFYNATSIPILGGLPPAVTYANGRFSNGPVWVDYFEASNPNINVFNLSMGGALSGTYAGIDNVADPDFGAIPIFGNSLKAAVTGLRSQVSSVPNVTGIDVAFAVFIGANDFLSSGTLGFESAIDIVPNVINNVETALNELVRRGADQFVLFNLPDLGRTPEAIISGREVELSQATLMLNQRVDELVTLGTNAGFDVDFIDTFGLFEQILASPATYGFSNVSSGCLNGILDFTLCGDPNASRLFWDSLHPTTQGHALFADAFGVATGFTTVVASSVSVPLPGALWLLLSAVVSMPLIRARKPSVRRHE